MVLTGGPGTGKTITTKGIINTFKANGFNIILAAPTGRAAKRMNETTCEEAKTMHRLLEYKPPNGYLKSIGDNHKLIPDKYAADIVHRMFDTVFNPRLTYLGGLFPFLLRCRP